MSEKRIALVTGGNRGIGKEICRQLGAKGLHVILGSRSLEKGEAAAAELREQGNPEIEVLELDVSSSASIEQAVETIKSKYGQLDVLVNNAGVFLDNNRETPSVRQVSVQTIEDTFAPNLFGPLQLMQGLLPLMEKQGYGRIVNLSSGMGQLSDMGGGSTAYRLSKTALNALTRIVAAEAEGNIKVNAMCPGWVQTDMGGENATRSVEQGADTATWLSLLDDDGPSGGFFRDRQPIDW